MHYTLTAASCIRSVPVQTKQSKKNTVIISIIQGSSFYLWAVGSETVSVSRVSSALSTSFSCSTSSSTHLSSSTTSWWKQKRRMTWKQPPFLLSFYVAECHWLSRMSLRCYRVVHVPVDAGKPPGLTARWLYFAQQTRMEFLLWSLTTSLEQKQTFLCKQPERHTKKYIMINHDYLCKWTAELFTNDYYYSIN